MSKNTKTFYSNDADIDLILFAVPKGLRSRFIRDSIKDKNPKKWMDELIKEKAEGEKT